MATMFFRTTAVSRASGANAVRRAAYISRSRIRADTLHRTVDYRARGGLLHSEILLPEKVAASADWALDRDMLWNVAERVERRSNARVATEFVVALPHELRADARLGLARSYAQTIADRYGAAVDLAVHSPPLGGDPRNVHAHMLSTTREVSEHGLGRKTDLHLRDDARRALGLGSWSAEMLTMRRLWAERANEYLHEAGFEVRLDPRLYWERGGDEIPAPAVSYAMVQRERRGLRSDAADRLRERHAANEQWLRERRDAAAREAVQTRAPTAEPSTEPDRAGRANTADPEEVERRAILRWIEYRERRQDDRRYALELSRELARERGAEPEF